MISLLLLRPLPTDFEPCPHWKGPSQWSCCWSLLLRKASTRPLAVKASRSCSCPLPPLPWALKPIAPRPPTSHLPGPTQAEHAPKPLKAKTTRSLVVSVRACERACVSSNFQFASSSINFIPGKLLSFPLHRVNEMQESLCCGNRFWKPGVLRARSKLRSE